MKIYLFRHGKYEECPLPTIPSDNVSLTAQARMDILKVSKSLHNTGIEKIYTSPVKRSVQTAEILSRSLGISHEKNELFRERRRPREIIGKLIEDTNVQKILKIIDENYFDMSFRYSNEENFLDLKTRAKHAIEFLHSSSERKVLLVTHAEFEAMLLSTMLFGDDLTPEIFIKLRPFFFVGLNTPSIVEFKDDRWRLLQWNRMLDTFLNL